MYSIDWLMPSPPPLLHVLLVRQTLRDERPGCQRHHRHHQEQVREFLVEHVVAPAGMEPGEEKVQAVCHEQHRGLQRRGGGDDALELGHLVPGGDPRLGKHRQHLGVRDQALLLVVLRGLGRPPRVEPSLVQRHNLVRRRSHENLVSRHPLRAVRRGHHRRRGPDVVALAHDAQRRRRQRAHRLRLVIANQRRPHELAHRRALPVFGVVEHLEHAHRVPPSLGVEVVVRDPVLAHDGVHRSLRVGVSNPVEHPAGGGVDEVRRDGGLARGRILGGGGDEDDVGREVLEERGPVAEDAGPAVDDLVGGLGGVSHDLSNLGREPLRPRLRRAVGRGSFAGGFVHRRGQEAVPAELVPLLVHGVVRDPGPVGVRGVTSVGRRREHVRRRSRGVHQKRRRRLVRVFRVFVGGARQREDVRSLKGEDDVGLDLPGVEVDDDGAGLGTPGGVRVRRGAHDQRVLAVPGLVPGRSPTVHRGVRIRARGLTLRVDAAAEEVAPEHAAVAVVQRRQRAGGGERDDLPAEAVGVSRGEELRAAAASEPGELRHLVRRGALDPGLDREHLRSEALLERGSHA
mmetsp:Transcript_9765/g.42556  ORF Transcript_9765/g.42556 Transcript_9765/m.42556 type:complete len:571 (+) Transcript_9765:1173-2885(+)